MKKNYQRIVSLAAFLMCVLPVFAANNTVEKLKSINQKISSVQKTIQTYQYKKESLQTNLKQTETQIGVLSKTIQHRKEQITNQKKALSSTNQQYNQLQNDLQQKEKMLAEQVKAAYIIGRQPFLKLLLNQEDPTQISRCLEYYRYLSQAQINAIQSIQQTAAEIRQTAESIKAQTIHLSKATTELSVKQVVLTDEQKKRKVLLSVTNQQLQSKQKQLEQLIADKEHFENVIREINLAQQFGYEPGQSFSQMRGKLHWPVDSRKVVQSFHQSIAGGRLQSTGIVVDDKTGAPVRAIFQGKVVFADWLNGFGLLTIIQHGDYLTLYGRNQSLYVKNGDIVQAGQLIATVGNSGGYHEPSLYFEIRKRNVPLNPTAWLTRK